MLNPANEKKVTTHRGYRISKDGSFYIARDRSKKVFCIDKSLTQVMLAIDEYLIDLAHKESEAPDESGY